MECEYADPRYVVLMPSAESSAAEFACLQTALHAICDEAPAADVSVTADDPAAFAALAGALEAQPRHFTIREAVLAPQETIPAAEAVGRICAAPAVSCPPAIPIVVSGEKITPAAVRLMQKYHVMQAAVLRKTI